VGETLACDWNSTDLLAEILELRVGLSNKGKFPLSEPFFSE
jgi:hypothetical protein